MNQIFASSAAIRSGPQQVVIDIIVGVAMAVVAVAVAVGLNLHFGLPLSRAVVAGVMIFALLLGAHFLIAPRRSTVPDVSELEDEELWRTLKEQRQATPDANRMAMATRTKPDDPVDDSPAGLIKAHIPSRKPRIRKPDQNAAADQTASVHAANPSDPTRAQPGSAGADKPEVDRSAAESDAYWSYRPNGDPLAEPGEAPWTNPTADETQQPATDLGAAQPQPVPVAKVSDAPQRSRDEAQAKAPRESDVELVQSMIKKLAHQVNASEVIEKTQTAPPESSAVELPDPEAMHTPPAAENVAAHGASAKSQRQDQQRSARQAPAGTPSSRAIQPPPLPAAPKAGVAQPASPPPSSPASIDLVGASVDALKSTAEALREADSAAPDGAPLVDQPLRPATHPDGAATAEELMSALSAGHYGVLLDPILSLDGLHTKHYEVRLQINTTAGARLETDSVEADLQATDALPLIDRQRFAKTMSVSDLLKARGKSGDVLTRMYRESLLDRDFCYAVATSGVANEHLARQLVLTLSQDAVRSLTATEWQTLSEFRELGYRFAISHVHDLDMDFSQLTDVGFSFVKLDAAMFLNGGSETGGSIPPQELARYFSGVGLRLIIDGVEDTSVAAELAALGAGLGQGPVSGGARLMKADAVASADNAVA